MDIRLLGPLRVVVDEDARTVGGAGEQQLLALLALAAGRVVPADTLVDRLWGEDLPSDPTNALQVRVSRLRRALRRLGLPDVLVVARRPGYVLDIPRDAVDASRFEDLVTAARAERDALSAGLRYAEALGQWRGPALAEFVGQPWARDEAARLDELRLAAGEEWTDLRLAAGEHTRLVAELTELVARHPLRERAHAQLMRALYRCGRQADALAVFQRLRETLADELGLDPSAELRDLERAVLRQDPALLVPASTPAPSPPALPTRLATFVGREAEQSALRETLAGHRLVTLTGPGGVGKTTLAIETVSRMTAEAPDGVWLVRLAGVQDPVGLRAALVEALGVPTGPGTAEERAVRHLRRRRALVLLDNCEHLVAECASLADRLLAACPALWLLATSREPLGLPGEAQLAVSPLTTPPEDVTAADLSSYASARLFLDRAREVDPGLVLDEAGVQAVARICRELDGLPLALELAAPRVKALPLQEVADRLHDRFRLLTSTARHRDPRQQTLRSTVEWSHQLLSEPERLLFRRLSVFRGGWTLAAAEAVCAGDGLDPDDVLDLLARLVDRSLVRAKQDRAGRFGMLESLRQYADERLAEAGERDRLCEAHAAWATTLAERGASGLRGPGQGRWLEELRAERDNLRAALAWADEQADGGELRLRLTAALGWFWYFTSAPEGVSELEGLLARTAGAPPRLRARALQALSLVARPGACLVHPDPRCASAARESLHLFRAIDDRVGAAYSGALLAVEGIGDADGGGALASLDRAAEAFEHAGDDWGRALVAFVRMELHFLGGDPGAGSTYGEQALHLFRRLEDHWGISAVQYHHASALHSAGRLDEALAVHEAALAEGRRGLTNTVPYVLAGLGLVTLELGDPDRAAGHLAEAHAVARRLGADRSPVASLGEGHLARERGDLVAARGHYTEALGALAGAGTPEWEAQALIGLGVLAELAGDLGEAESAHLRAWQTASAAAGSGAGAGAAALEGLACVATARGDGDLAARLLGTADRWRGWHHRPASRLARRDVDRAATAARRLLGDGGYRAAYDAGVEPPDGTVVDLRRTVAQVGEWVRRRTAPGLTAAVRAGPGASAG